MVGQPLPRIIQGGMGVAVSGWRLARAVSTAGQLGVVSGTALDIVMVRRLQSGDPGGHVRRALADAPWPEMSERVIDRYYRPEGERGDSPFAALRMLDDTPEQERQELVVLANFVEVWLAKEGHTGDVGVNFLEKIQPPTLPALFGALVAGVDYVLMGAGIPAAIPGAIDALVEGRPAAIPLRVEGATADDDYQLRFDPERFTGGRLPWMRRPNFFPIVASSTLATRLARKSTGAVDGFVVEGHTAGGHNAPPRGKGDLSPSGEPVYGPRDEVDLAAFRKLGLPFWMAGSYGTPERFSEALDGGAAGVQVGTAFAFCDESGLSPEIRREVLDQCRAGELSVRTDPLASPTGFPFKVLSVLGSLSDSFVYQLRKRKCDLGFLRQAFKLPDGSLGWRCPAEPEASYVKKGGDPCDTEGRQCVCNGLMAAIGLGQTSRDGVAEPPLVTAGDEAHHLTRWLKTPDAPSYSARDVIDYLLAALPTPQTAPTA